MTATTTAFEEGSPESPICLVGEAPSTWEIRASKPFVGPSGQLLDLCLHTAKIVRANTYIVNTFEDQVYKKRDDQSKIFTREGYLLWQAGKGFTDLGKEKSEPCLKRLQACNANVIVPLGRPALNLCADTRSIDSWRGSIIPANDSLSQRKLIPSTHPASCLHGNYANRFLIMSDFRKAKYQSAFPEIHLLNRKLIVDPGFDECVRFLKHCLQSLRVNTDIELLNGQIDCFSLCTSTSEAICIPMLDAGFENRWSDSEEAELWRLYAEIISHAEIEKINQNITFDFSTLLWLNKIIPRGPLHDPMVAHSIMYPFLKKNLGTLCSLYTDEPYYKDDGELHDSPSVADFIKRWEYNAKDSIVSLQCWDWLEPLIEPEGYRATYDMTMNMVGSLIYMMARGIKLDEAALLEMRAKVKGEIAAMVVELSALLGRPVVVEAPKRAAEKRKALAENAININSSQQVCKYFYEEKGLKAYVNHQGKPTVDDIALTRISRRYDLPEAKLLQTYRAAAKVLGTYLEMGYDVDRRLRSSFNPRGTWSGRLSSSQTVFGNGGNLQNLIPELRGFLVSDEVEVLINAESTT